MTALTPPVPDLLYQWMPQQRWYPAKGRGVGLRELATVPLGSSEDGARIDVLVVGLDSGDRFDVVQVPLTFRSSPLPGATHALVGETHDADRGHQWVYDGPHDPAYVEALLASLSSPSGGSSSLPTRPSRVLSGEQSNTSIIVGESSSRPSIAKVFRTLHGGANPDVEVLAALSSAGCREVPELLGWLDGQWTTRGGERVFGHLAVATEFLAGSQDAWREAVAAVEQGLDFSGQARELGEATAAVHVALAQAFGTVPADETTRNGLVQGLRQRVAWAQRSTDALDDVEEPLRTHVESLANLTDLPPLQRVHGDYHLGQVLHAPGRGWVLLDFEGEPLRPLHERTLPDLALRDVAGMLRSFDYAARHVTVGRDDPQLEARADAWASSARDAFCAGYASASGSDPRDRPQLLGALELDKALYEVVYESGNRPAWLDVPLHAVRRLLA